MLYYLEKLHTGKDKYFGNARTVRNLVQEVVKLQNIRLSLLSPTELELADKNLILAEDLRELRHEETRSKAFERPRLGFRPN